MSKLLQPELAPPAAAEGTDRIADAGNFSCGYWRLTVSTTVHFCQLQTLKQMAYNKGRDALEMPKSSTVDTGVKRGVSRIDNQRAALSGLPFLWHSKPLLG